MKTTQEIEQPQIDYCGIADQRLVNLLGEVLVHNHLPDWADDHEREMLRGLLTYEYESEDGRTSYHLTIRGHLVYDLLANNGRHLMEAGHEEW